ncbi:hypothetical protein QTP88_012901 [Uroleucon formosanum]
MNKLLKVPHTKQVFPSEAICLPLLEHKPIILSSFLSSNNTNSESLCIIISSLNLGSNEFPSYFLLHNIIYKYLRLDNQVDKNNLTTNGTKKDTDRKCPDQYRTLLRRLLTIRNVDDTADGHDRRRCDGRPLMSLWQRSSAIMLSQSTVEHQHRNDDVECCRSYLLRPLPIKATARTSDQL